MGLYRRPSTEGLPSFVTTNTANRRPIFRSTSACRLFVETLYAVRSEARISILAFAVMPDHIHAVVVAEEGALGRAMQLLKGRFARAHNQATSGEGSVWQSRYHEVTLRSEAALLRAMEYVEQNPVVAGLAAEPVAYPCSSASGQLPTDLASYFGQAEPDPGEASTTLRSG